MRRAPSPSPGWSAPSAKPSYRFRQNWESWLKENGGAIVLGLVLAFGSIFGIKQWQIWDINQRQQASAEYEVMIALLSTGNLDAAVSNYETLKLNFSGSPYVSLAALHMAKARLDAGQVDLSIQIFEYAMENAEPEVISVIARQRLARVKVDQGSFDEALELINGVRSASGFEAQFAEIKGDIYRAKGEIDEAARYYTEALDALESGTGDRDYLEIKLESTKSSGIEEGETS